MSKTNTSEHEASHGKKPRGEGLWFFKIVFTDGHGRYSTETVTVNDKLPKAKQRAWKHVKSICGGAKELVELIVLP